MGPEFVFIYVNGKGGSKQVLKRESSLLCKGPKDICTFKSYSHWLEPTFTMKKYNLDSIKNSTKL